MIFILFILTSLVVGKLTHFITLSSNQFDFQEEHDYGQDYSLSIYQGEQFARQYFDLYSKKQKLDNDRIKQPEQQVKYVCDPEKIMLVGQYSFEQILQQIGFINAFCMGDAGEVLRKVQNLQIQKYVEDELEINEEYRQFLLKQNLTNPMSYQNISMFSKYLGYDTIMLPQICPNIQYYYEQGLREILQDKEFKEIVEDQYFLANFVKEKVEKGVVIQYSKLIWSLYVQTSLLIQYQENQNINLSLDLKSVQQVSDMIYLQTFKYFLARKETVQLIIYQFILNIKAVYAESKMIVDVQEEITLMAFIKMMLTDEEIYERRYELIPQKYSKLILTFKSNDVLIQFNGIILRKLQKCKSETKETCTIDDFFNIINDYEIVDFELICFK